MYSFRPTSRCEHDERADAPAGEEHRRAHDLLDRLALRQPLHARREERPGADLRQRAADVVLEDDDDEDQDDVAEESSDPVDRVELEDCAP